MYPEFSENPEPKRLTRFPGAKSNAHLLPSSDVDESELDHRRETRFPGKSQYKPTLATTLESFPPQSVENKSVTDSLLFVPINEPSSSRSRSLSIEATHIPKVIESKVLTESPWDTYRPLRTLAPGIQVEVASSRAVPVIIVTMREIKDVVRWDKVVRIQHQNLVHFIEAYNYMSKMITVSEFMQVSMKQVIAIPYDFKEIHISTVCSQVLDGMQYLSKNHVYTKLDSSTAFLSSDGCVKIAYIGYARKRKPENARAIGLLALEMMQKGVIQNEIAKDDELAPLSPELWSGELINFLKTTSTHTVELIEKGSFLRCSSISVMLPFICYAHLEAISPLLEDV